MNLHLLFGAMLAIPMAFHAQHSYGQDVDAEIDSLYQSANVNNQAAPALPAQNARAGQPVYIVNQSSQATTSQAQAQQLQQQPTTFIEATPLSNSRAEQIRKARQDAELQTEQRIVEKLEASRMEDEKRRADALFGDRLNNNHPPVVHQPVVQQPVVVAPAIEKVVIREEIRAPRPEPIETAPSQSYITGVAGLGDYPDVNNVRGNYLFGFNVGSNYEGLVIEGGFTYGSYSVDQLNFYSYLPTRVDVSQYSGHLATKFEFVTGRVRPWAGGLASVSYRTFKWDSYSNYYSTQPYNYSQDDSASSTALDLGVTAGVDLAVTHKMSVGLDFRYLFNITSRRNNDKSVYYNDANYAYGKPLEGLQYYVVGLGLKYHF